MPLFFWPIRENARKQQQLQQQQEDSGSAPVPAEVKVATALTDQEPRKVLKFGFSSKGGTSKVCPISLSLSLSPLSDIQSDFRTLDL